MTARRPLLLSTLLAVSVQCAAAEVSVQSRRDGEAIELTAVAQLAADPAVAWSVLTDYESYPRFIPDLAVSHVVARHGADLVLEQEGEFRLWWWRVPQAVRLAVVETPPRLVRSRLLTGTVEAMEGRYELAPGAAGVTLTYTGRVVLTAEQRGLFDQWLVRRAVSSQFRALAVEIERRARRGGEALGLAAPADGIR